MLCRRWHDSWSVNQRDVVHPCYKTTYVAGDTILTQHVTGVVEQYNPEIIVLNTGYSCATGIEGSIIMGKYDLLRA